jgi:glycerol uptake facilitator-like aquaporin
MKRSALQVVLSELLGTAFLVGAVVGSGIAASRLSPQDRGLQLLESSLATGAALIAVIVALQPISAAFNPLVTLLELSFGQIAARLAAWSVAAQVVGAAIGAVTANLMFGLSAVAPSHHVRTGPGLWLAEAVASLGLLLVVFGAARSGRNAHAPYAVGAYIAAAYWFTSSTSFANPAIDVGRMFSNTFAGIAPPSVPSFIVFQLIGGAVAIGAVRVLYPDITPEEASEIMRPQSAGQTLSAPGRSA